MKYIEHIVLEGIDELHILQDAINCFNSKSTDKITVIDTTKPKELGKNFFKVSISLNYAYELFYLGRLAGIIKSKKIVME